MSSRSQLREGEALFRSGDPFRALFALRRGFLKSTVSTADGREQVTGFHMTGDVVGLDAIPDARHRVDVVALEVTEVCVIGYEDFSDIADHLPTLQKNLARIMGQRIAGDHRTILFLGRFSAEEKLASFLLTLSSRYARRAYSSREFVLRMSRTDIASYLGLTPETVSRTFAALRKRHIVEGDRRFVCIVDPEGLHALASAKRA